MEELPINTEALPLIRKHSENTYLPKIGKKIGSALGFSLTTLSMLIQGVLAFLLWELIWRNNAEDKFSPIVSEIILYFIGMLLFVGSILGKVALVSPYNQVNFEQLGFSTEKLLFAKKQWLGEKRAQLQAWSIKDVVIAIPNTIMTVNVSLVFGIGVTHLGTHGMAIILRKYHRAFPNHVANIITAGYVELPLMMATIACNLLAFPYIHLNALNIFKRFCQFFIRHPSYAAVRNDLIACLQAAQWEWKNCSESRNSQKVNSMLSELLDSSPEDYQGFDIKQLTMTQVDNILNHEINIAELIRVGKANIGAVKAESWFEFVVTRSLSTVILGAVLYGLSNFIDIAGNTMQLLHASFLTTPAGVLDFISMGCIALDAVFQPTVDFFKYAIFGRNYAANILSWPLRLSLATAVSILIWLGGFPNGAQEAQIGGNVLQISIAVFAVWIELFPTYNLLKRLAENVVMKHDPFAKLIHSIEKKITQKITELHLLDSDNIKVLASEYMAPEQADRIRVLAPERKVFSQIRGGARNFFWRTKVNTGSILANEVSDSSYSCCVS